MSSKVDSIDDVVSIDDGNYNGNSLKDEVIDVDDEIDVDVDIDVDDNVDDDCFFHNFV